VHLLAAKRIGQGWEDYLMSLIQLLHCVEHLRAVVGNEQGLLVNTWEVITADGQIGFFEKRRMLKVCTQTQDIMRIVSDKAVQIALPQSIIEVTGIDNWKEQCPTFELVEVDKDNWPDWCQAASEVMDHLYYALGLIQSAALEELINREATVAQYLADNSALEAAPVAGSSPDEYPVLLPGNEHVLQRKLDLWNRFQLAHGFMPTMLRLVVSLGIVGGTLYSGIVGI
jgi:hypothetical protein